mmetsp:Transcript_53725/g.98871  ORF Transcript_53725/g.98871 Transcript_53725/m.98871 type:complete len:243 (+) Transcript_53725:57-785(+)
MSVFTLAFCGGLCSLLFCSFCSFCGLLLCLLLLLHLLDELLNLSLDDQSDPRPKLLCSKGAFGEAQINLQLAAQNSHCGAVQIRLRKHLLQLHANFVRRNCRWQVGPRFLVLRRLLGLLLRTTTAAATTRTAFTFALPSFPSVFGRRLLSLGSSSSLLLLLLLQQRSISISLLPCMHERGREVRDIRLGMLSPRVQHLANERFFEALLVDLAFLEAFQPSYSLHLSLAIVLQTALMCTPSSF